MAGLEACSSTMCLSSTLVQQHLQGFKTQHHDTPSMSPPSEDSFRKVAVDFSVVANLIYPANALRDKVEYNAIGSPLGLLAGKTAMESAVDTQLCRAKKFLARANFRCDNTQHSRLQDTSESRKWVSPSLQVYQDTANQVDGGAAVEGCDPFPVWIPSNLPFPDSARLLWDGILWWESIGGGSFTPCQIHCRISWELPEERWKGPYTLNIPANAKLCLLSNALLHGVNPAHLAIEDPRMLLELYSSFGENPLQVLLSSLDYGKTCVQ